MKQHWEVRATAPDGVEWVLGTVAGHTYVIGDPTLSMALLYRSDFPEVQAVRFDSEEAAWAWLRVGECDPTWDWRVARVQVLPEGHTEEDWRNAVRSAFETLDQRSPAPSTKTWFDKVVSLLFDPF